MNKYEEFKTLSLTLKVLYIFVAANLAMIAIALTVGIARMIIAVFQEGLRGSFALTEFLLVLLVVTLISFQYRIYIQWREERKTTSREEIYYVVAPAGGRFLN